MCKIGGGVDCQMIADLPLIGNKPGKPGKLVSWLATITRPRTLKKNKKKEAHLELFFTRADLNKSGDVDLKEATKYVNLEIFPSRKSKNIKRAKSKAKGQ